MGLKRMVSRARKKKAYHEFAGSWRDEKRRRIEDPQDGVARLGHKPSLPDWDRQMRKMIAEAKERIEKAAEARKQQEIPTLEWDEEPV